LPFCKHCGDEIEFRYIDGQRTPIHIHGGRCLTRNYSDKNNYLWESTTQISALESYINPNAKCPVCDKPVFFYQSPDGGRVFFDDLGWPWPKHPCTNNSSPQHRTIQSTGIKSGKFYFKNKHDEPLVMYRLLNHIVRDNRLYAKFNKIGSNLIFCASVSIESLQENSTNAQDFLDAPSFVKKKINDQPSYRLVEFISTRLQKIQGIKMRLEKERITISF